MKCLPSCLCVYYATGYLKSKLADYISNLQRVRLIRTNKREGLVRARLIGATFATGDVLTFLDCHCECVPGWIEPLLERCLNIFLTSFKALRHSHRTNPPPPHPPFHFLFHPTFCTLLPLRIGENESTIVCPVIDTIDWNTFEYYMQTDEPMIGGFDWRLTFQWHSVPEVERKRRKSRIDPIR